MYRPHSSTKKEKTRHYNLSVTEHANGALSCCIIADWPNAGAADLLSVGSPNGRTSDHGFFTTLGLAIGEQFKKA
jgi:hypothetical protein